MTLSQRNDVLELMEDRHGSRCTLVTSQLPVHQWHEANGFRFYWRWKSRRGRGGRPKIDPEVRQLIRTMSRDNIGWGAPRIHGELSMLGIEILQATVAK